ncbi:hypothetical protein ACFQAT_10560 [Undibacterium arcticum]|uniref:HNH endonuclease n=1 Tax=Undibacterium arcticum TaxID=1762892 RepID=A0ABV7FBV4_9BURK
MPDHEHEFKETIAIDIFYPDHPPRTESTLFKRTKHHLVKVLDTPCWVCGSKDKREVHHFHAEWADSDGIDWDKMRILHPAFPWSTFNYPSDFIDAEYNMMVLCETHHRSKNHGIHLLPYPIWIMQREQRADFVFAPEVA